VSARSNRVVPSGGAFGAIFSAPGGPTTLRTRLVVHEGSSPSAEARELTYPVSKRGDNSVKESGRASPVRYRVVLAGAAPGGPVFDTRQGATQKREKGRVTPARRELITRGKLGAYVGPSRAACPRGGRTPAMARSGSSAPRTSGVMRAVKPSDFLVSSRRDVTAVRARRPFAWRVA
jgi:hypothetical protein